MRGSRIAGVDRSISLNHDGSFASGRRCLRRDCKDFDLRFDRRLSVAAQRPAVPRAAARISDGGHILELGGTVLLPSTDKVGHLSGFSSATKG
jgi:hypothetical protein